jgi:acetylornithine deacetylase/succinyl-diaminopimelate desuccinylase-like protein
MGVSIVEHLQAAINERELVECARQLIRVPSVTGNETAVMAAACEWLQTRGVAPRLVARDPSRPNVVADIGGAAGPLLVLNGHLDTVPVGAGEGWTHDPFGGSVEGGCLYGRGALDMKGACAVMMHVAAILRGSSRALGGRLQLQLVSDEEESGFYGTQHLVERLDAGELPRPDGVLIGEKSDLRIRIAERGHFQFQLVFRGRAAHTAMARVAAVNPIVHAAAAVLRLDGPLQTFHPAVGYPIISVNRIDAGVVTNQVPAQCTVTVDRRLVPGESPETVAAEVHRALAAVRREIPNLDYELVPIKGPEGRVEFSPANMTPVEHPFVADVQTAYRQATGEDPQLFVDWGGGTDARLFRARGIPTVVVGAVGRGFHGADEFARIDSLVTLARVYLATALRLANRQG